MRKKKQYLIRKWGLWFVGDSALQLTIREMRQLFTSPKAIAGLGVTIFVLGVSGPFDTFENLIFLPRLIYWAAVATVSFAVGSFCGTLMVHLTGGWLSSGSWLHRSFWLVMIGSSSGLPVTLVVLAINTLAFGPSDLTFPSIFSLAIYCVAISIGISLIFLVFSGKKTAASSNIPPRILTRLPLQLRGEIISLSVQDHYVDVTTTRGSTLVLMRLTDAIAETGEVAGLQIHRSHWVALNRVKAVKREKGRVLLETENGVFLPVSRTYLPAVRDAGFLI